jgi:endonuclease YncB( thermonuclease family)
VFGGGDQKVKWLAIAVLCWTVMAYPGRAIDGDTFDATTYTTTAYPKIRVTVEVDERIRVLGVDTPERRLATMQEYLAAKSFTETWIKLGTVRLEVGCTGQPDYDNFGRMLAVVTRDGKNLADELIGAGLGVKR